MMFRFSKGQFDVPEGKYLCRFLGVKPLPADPNRLGNDGKPMGPAVVWEFEVIDGEHAGKKCDRVSGIVPTAKSACGKLLSAVTDAILKDGMAVDVSQYVGKKYRVTVEQKPSGNGTRVSDLHLPVRVYEAGEQPASPPPAPARPTAGVAPPPRNPQREPVKKDPGFWVDAGPGDPVTMGRDELTVWGQNQGRVAADVNVCPVGGDAWKPASEYGFDFSQSF